MKKLLNSEVSFSWGMILNIAVALVLLDYFFYDADYLGFFLKSLQFSNSGMKFLALFIIPIFIFCVYKSFKGFALFMSVVLHENLWETSSWKERIEFVTSFILMVAILGVLTYFIIILVKRLYLIFLG